MLHRIVISIATRNCGLENSQNFFQRFWIEDIAKKFFKKN